MNIAIIPARGGSKRIPRKNVRDFCGKPIIAYSIQAALASKLFEHIIISTDDDSIASVACEYGGTAPFRRPAKLADDMTGTTSVLRHALQWCQNNIGNVDKICCIYATAPFISVQDLKLGMDALSEAPAAFSVTNFAYPIFRALHRDESGTVSMFWPEHINTRSQDLQEGWHDAAQFYWAKSDYLLNGGDFMLGEAKGIHIPRIRVQDIDTEEDWELAELLFTALNAMRTAN